MSNGTVKTNYNLTDCKKPPLENARGGVKNDAFDGGGFSFNL